MEKIELLAPAGNKECFIAAINNGANAIYIGADAFSARAYATNFSLEEIEELVKYAHIRDVKVFVGINTMIYDNELTKVFDYVDRLYVSDVDALIVADFGLINALNERYPGLEIHVSTQLNTHSLWQVKLLERLGIQRVVLSRETPISTVKYIKKNSNMDIEVFAHGALCVCYSGNCLQSSMIGKRSGNRGKCAQPCRMEYTLMQGDKKVSDKKFLLSMKDLNTLEHIDELIESGISSLKIEGRMKSPEYVALVTKAYREAIDRYYETKEKSLDIHMMEKLKLTFSREFTKGFLFNESNKYITNTFRGNNIGVRIGKVTKINKNGRTEIKLTDNVNQKDKIVILQDSNDIGLFLSKIYVKDRLVNKAYKDEIIEIDLSSKVKPDSLVYKVIDNELNEELARTYASDLAAVKIRMKFSSKVGAPLALNVKDGNGHSILVKSDYIVEEARTSVTTSAKIEEQLNKLKSTCYVATIIDINNDNKGIIPIKCINELRREALEKLDEARSNIYHRDVSTIKEITSPELSFKNQANKFKVKVKNIYQLEAISDIEGIDEIYYDDVYSYKMAVSRFPRLNLVPVLPRINNDRANFEVHAKSFVINNFGDLEKYTNERVSTDLYMNVANKLTYSKLKELGVENITLSTEMNKFQIEELIDDIRNTYGDASGIEMVVYGKIQTMVTKYCFISKEMGYEKKNCGACRKSNNFFLQDRMNYKFPVLTDLDCNVTIYNSKALHLIDYLTEIRAIGVNNLRLDFSNESPQEVADITRAYLSELNEGYHDLYIRDVTYGYYLDSENN